MVGFRWASMILAVVLFFSAVPLAAAAPEPGASDWALSEAGRVRLVAARASLSDSKTVRLGLQFDLAPNWKIYWRTPGDAGYPPRIDWSGSRGLGDVVIRWPAPHRFVLAGLQNYGYQGEVVLPIDAILSAPGRAVSLKAKVEFLACAQLCVPQQADLSLDLAAGDGVASIYAHNIARFDSLVPGEGERHGLFLNRAEAAGTGESGRLRLVVNADEPFTDPDLFVESADIPAFAQPLVILSPDRHEATFEIAPSSPPSRSLIGASLTVTVVDGQRSLEATVQPVAAAADATPLVGMLLIALLGGLILNLMPCVLPVLSIKLLGILGHGGGERAHARLSFLASAAGIVASFLALAGLAIALRQAGLSVGWGIQFQQPGFLAVMVLVLLLFAANLWGGFEIGLPRWLLDRTPAGESQPSLRGHFLSGALATLLATPCSAPFLGTAIGFALARGPVEIVLIFAALGLGMAAPFLLVAVWPDAVLRLPRPGRWMIRVRVVMGMALAGTALWLLLVLIEQIQMPSPPQDKAVSTGAIPWSRFDPGAIPGLVAEGKIVFVDVTADWCITCKVNAFAVLGRGETARRLSAPGYVAMRADWTRPDVVVTDYLASFGRYGIPFNAVYGPGAPEGIALPELLSEQTVLDALARAAKSPSTAEPSGEEVTPAPADG
ncbi:protein-disulfide reductase DsbD family protein [Magnetospirillum molischianum]|uniref:Thiol:disulfide interchange protein dsbD 1 n=1 Tax=Magnetospirillum molischianum DSM 120 TaxID=1150626 RepID=H8FV73_MAGML|nr:protein-disulfide reductase DsbD domain-containing protein [Magnetospirillum molischianum]CCG42261.1 Thiol:disulfide interchange protein dsbD 1 [Magnetospirillum molischianum DSM 120]